MVLSRPIRIGAYMQLVTESFKSLADPGLSCRGITMIRREVSGSTQNGNTGRIGASVTRLEIHNVQEMV